MYSTNSFLRLVSICSFLILMSACMKTVPPSTSNNNNNPGGNSNVNTVPTITPVGIPIGDVVTKTIGSAGGSIVSDDSVVELNIPAGALASDQEIGIQSITNETPNGIGFSYHLTPDGTTFKIPVTLIFHYVDVQLNGIEPYLLFVAYQDSSNAWQADRIQRDVDTTKKTVSLEIGHFSDWSLGGTLSIDAYPKEYQANNTGQASVRLVLNSEPANTPSGTGLEAIVENLVNPSEVTNWAVNSKIGGNNTLGTIAANGNPTSYKAPANIENSQKVEISTIYHGLVSRYNHGILQFKNKDFPLKTFITLEPEIIRFYLHIEHKDIIHGGQENTYLDYADMEVDVIGKNAQIPPASITNHPPTMSNPSYGIGQCTVHYLIEQFGSINITGGNGGVVQLGFDPRQVHLALNQSDLHDYGEDFVCKPDHSTDFHLKILPRIVDKPLEVTFYLDAPNLQTIPIDDANPDNTIIVTVSPL